MTNGIISPFQFTNSHFSVITYPLVLRLQECAPYAETAQMKLCIVMLEIGNRSIPIFVSHKSIKQKQNKPREIQQ